VHPVDRRTTITSTPMSVALLVVNLAVFVAVSVETDLLAVLALPPDWAGVSEQPWTVLTVFFTSEALIHIAAALLVIGLFGTMLERVAGPAHLLAVYLLGGLAGSLALLTAGAATGFDEPSVGASAAFLALMGALVALPRRTWGDRLPMDKVVVVLLVIQVAPAVGIGEWVSSAAHLTGLAVGAGYGYLLRPRAARELRDTTSASPEPLG
jgi:membrane associated rhomboid family serine protease